MAACGSAQMPKGGVRNVEVPLLLEVGEWEGVLLEMVCWSVGVAIGVGSRSTPGWYPWGSGVKTMACLQPLSLRCIFYKGAVAEAGFHLLLSVCLGLRRCWISVFGNVIAPLGSPM